MRGKSRKPRLKNTYSVYKKLYRKAEKSMKKAGFEMFDKGGMLSRKEFWDEYRSHSLLNKELPKKEQSRNIARDIVSSQQYSKSLKYAKHLKEGLFRYYASEHGEQYAKEKLKEAKVTLRNIRSGQVDFDVLKNEYWYLKDMGYSSEEAAEEIAGEYFGS